jgi:hypothetical protein
MNKYVWLLESYNDYDGWSDIDWAYDSEEKAEKA